MALTREGEDEGVPILPLVSQYYHLQPIRLSLTLDHLNTYVKLCCSIFIKMYMCVIIRSNDYYDYTIFMDNFFFTSLKSHILWFKPFFLKHFIIKC